MGSVRKSDTCPFLHFERMPLSTSVLTSQWGSLGSLDNLIYCVKILSTLVWEVYQCWVYLLSQKAVNHLR